MENNAENEVSIWSELEVSEKQHWITNDFRGRGDLAFEGVLRFSGKWTGNIKGEGEGNQLILMEGAVVSGKIEVETLIIEGGDLRDVTIEAADLHIHPRARIRGNIQSANLRIDEGAIIEGAIVMAT